MVHFVSTVVLAVAALSMHAQGLPLNKRIAQVIADSTTQWEAACDAAGGGEQCNPTAVTAFSTLLAAAGPCDQQNSADAMIDLAKQLNNDPDMIKFAQIFAQQPRNSPSSQAVPYCQQAPKNAELNGLFQCQFQSADETTFVGGLTVGSAGTIPFGMTSPVSPAGSCPANPSGPIADGTQLVDITQNPGVSGSSGSGNNAASASSSASTIASSAVASPSATDSSDADSDSDSDCDDGDDGDDSASSAAAPVASTTAAAAPVSSSAASSGNSSSFQLQNGQAAQALNAKFAALTATSSCNEGDMACINGGFAQCVSGQFVITACGAGTTCAALPLVNKAGTSIACTTQSDALARIAATGAQGGLTGSN